MIQNLFSIPVWYDLVDPNSYNKEQLLNVIEKNYKNNPKRDKWHGISNMHHSNSDEDNEDYEQLNYNILKVVYQNKINQFVKEVLGDINDQTCNLNIVNYTAMGSGGHMTRHDHLSRDCEFVGVHYLKFHQDEHYPIRFWNPHTLYPQLSNIHPLLKNINVCQRYFAPIVQEDMILIYPSFLEHDIPQQKETDSLRVSIAFNFKFYKDESDD